VTAQAERPLDPAAFIAANLHLLPAPGLPDIILYTAHPKSGLRRLAGDGDGEPPYWAYHWAGGTVLARHILAHPETVRDRRVLDLGTGSGVVAIAAAKAGAATVTAVDIDPNAVAASRLNAAANGVVIDLVCGDLLDGDVPDVDLILVGDLFYDAALAARVMAFLDRCRAVSVDVLIGDPGRTPLPLGRLTLLAEYAVADFGVAGEGAGRVSGVFTLRDAAARDGLR
jgi:predicted nicotinamide N-methyase